MCFVKTRGFASKGNQKALKDQEEISRELTDALGDKEKQYAELELLFMDMKRTQRHMTGEFEKEKNDYERKILDLRKIYSSLEEEVCGFLDFTSTEVSLLSSQGITIYVSSCSNTGSIRDNGSIRSLLDL